VRVRVRRDIGLLDKSVHDVASDVLLVATTTRNPLPEKRERDL
jgi:hypothetical protein